MASVSELYFATSGIRGKANTEISPELGLRVGRAVANWIKHEQEPTYVYVGYDNRRNSHTIASTVVAGLSSSGIDAKIFTEPVPTPLVIFATTKSEANAGVMITGSHLPRDENGVILFDDEGNYFKGTLPNPKVPPVEWKELGRIHNISREIDEYQIFLRKVAKSSNLQESNWNLLIDPVHGPMKNFLEKTIKPYVHNIVKFNWESDDRFSGRLSEPTPSNLEKTSKAVTVSNCDLGIATDMDGDRVIFITSEGNVISGDYVGAILAKRFWEKYPDIPVVVPINTSAIINHVAEEVDGKIAYCKVGPPSIIRKMKETGAKYGFEETGKYLFADLAAWPDSCVSTILLMSYLQEKELTLQAIIDNMPSLSLLKSKVPSSRDQGEQIMEIVSGIYSEHFSDISNIEDLDGMRINFDDRSWILIRPSGTENYVRVFSEHPDKEQNVILNQKGRELVQLALRQLNE